MLFNIFFLFKNKIRVDLMNFDTWDNKYKLGILLFALSIFYILFTSYLGIANLKIWADEIFSFFAVAPPFNEFMEIVIGNVHPPLYYFILKFFIKLFTLCGFNDVYIIGVIVSLIPVYLILILAATKVRKNFGMLTAGIFALCITSMPQLMQYATEIRMYSWGLFFVTASFIYVYEIIKESTWKKWAILTVLTICSAYTHYFTGIASFSIYLTLLVYILYKRRDMLKNWIISCVVSVLAFIPWVSVALNQFNSVMEWYWIDPINFNTIISYIYYVLYPADVVVKGNDLVAPTILGTIALIAVIVLIYQYIKSKKEINNSYAIWAIILFVSVPLIGIVLSLVYKPIFHIRYLVPALGCFWLGISILLAKTYDNKKIFLPILAVILIIGAMGAFNFYQNDVEELPPSEFEEPFNELKNHVKYGDIIFCDLTAMMRYSEMKLPPTNIILWNLDNISEKIKQTIEEDPAYKSLIDSGSNIYYIDFIGKDNYESDSRSNYEDCLKQNITLEKIDVHSDMIHVYKIVT